MSDIDYSNNKISVVIPCYREKAHVLDVISRIPDYVDNIICVDDCCPDKTGEFIKQNCDDNRIVIITHDKNQGVGGAMISGYKAALDSSADIIVKIDGDGQMDPELLPQFINPIINNNSDYTKGNRFFDIENISAMPIMRLLGNAVLSFMSKLSTGYWKTFDPNNGYTAINAKALKHIPLQKINPGYFFESDMLFRLNTLHAVVVDIPMVAKYGEETSHVNIFNSIFIFSFFHTRNFFKRIIYNYFLRDFSVASLEWIAGPAMISFSLLFGTKEWISSTSSGISATAGTVMLAALPMIVGIQMLLSALSYDIENMPTVPLSKLVAEK
jgi:glycosyltransferase involved in cell wall biosynthesis